MFFDRLKHLIRIRLHPPQGMPDLYGHERPPSFSEGEERRKSRWRMVPILLGLSFIPWVFNTFIAPENTSPPPADFTGLFMDATATPVPTDSPTPSPSATTIPAWSLDDWMVPEMYDDFEREFSPTVVRRRVFTPTPQRPRFLSPEERRRQRQRERMKYQ